MSGSILVHNLVVATFSKLGMPPPIDVCETFLVKDGFFIGHKFRCDGGYAVWGAGWNSVEFYDQNGKLLKDGRRQKGIAFIRMRATQHFSILNELLAEQEALALFRRAV